MLGIMNTFTSYKVEDFFGRKHREPMQASEFFGIIAMLQVLDKKSKQQARRSKNKFGRR